MNFIISWAKRKMEKIKVSHLLFPKKATVHDSSFLIYISVSYGHSIVAIVLALFIKSSGYYI